MRPSKTTLLLVKEKCETEKNSTWQQQLLVWHQAKDVQIYVDAEEGRSLKWDINLL